MTKNPLGRVRRLPTGDGDAGLHVDVLVRPPTNPAWRLMWMAIGIERQLKHLLRSRERSVDEGTRLFPIELADGAGVAVEVPVLGGELAFLNDGGVLRITLPAVAAISLPDHVHQGAERSSDAAPGGGLNLWFRPRPGQQVTVPLPSEGFVAVAFP